MAQELIVTAARLSKGNWLHPTRLVLTPHELRFEKRKTFGRHSESVRLDQIVRVGLNTGMLFATFFIETETGHRLEASGLPKPDAERLREQLGAWQQSPPAPEASVAPLGHRAEIDPA
jgi:hypothetical protein